MDQREKELMEKIIKLRKLDNTTTYEYEVAQNSNFRTLVCTCGTYKESHEGSVKYIERIVDGKVGEFEASKVVEEGPSSNVLSLSWIITRLALLNDVAEVHHELRQVKSMDKQSWFCLIVNGEPFRLNGTIGGMIYIIEKKIEYWKANAGKPVKFLGSYEGIHTLLRAVKALENVNPSIYYTMTQLDEKYTLLKYITTDGVDRSRKGTLEATIEFLFDSEERYRTDLKQAADEVLISREKSIKRLIQQSKIYWGAGSLKGVLDDSLDHSLHDLMRKLHKLCTGTDILDSYDEETFPLFYPGHGVGMGIFFDDAKDAKRGLSIFIDGINKGIEIERRSHGIK